MRIQNSLESLAKVFYRTNILYNVNGNFIPDWVIMPVSIRKSVYIRPGE